MPLNRWPSILEAVDSVALDCVQTGLALLLEYHGGPHSYVALGSSWKITFQESDGLTTLDASVDRRIEEAKAAGLTMVESWHKLTRRTLEAAVEERGPVFVMCDAFCLPWLPGCRKVHAGHSVILDRIGGRLTAVDAYSNITPDGPAEPGSWTLDDRTLDRVIGSATYAGIAEFSGSVDAAIDSVFENAIALRSANVDRYIADLIENRNCETAGLDRLVLDTWLLARERRLHGLWLARHGWKAVDPTIDFDAHVARLGQVALEAFVASRRMARDRRGVPIETIERYADVLADEPRIARAIAIAVLRSRVSSVVNRELAGSLGLNEVDIAEAETLRDIPGFTSVRLVDTVVRIERALHIADDDVRLAAGDLVSRTSLERRYLAELLRVKGVD